MYYNSFFLINPFNKGMFFYNLVKYGPNIFNNTLICRDSVFCIKTILSQGYNRL